jgi:cysteinyl-tRNA synthetase
MEAGARIEVSEKKRNPGDFAMWKSSKPGEPAWDSPWGRGRPGWHIECSAMSMKYFGHTLDIHGGGLDLKFPHHENELAQSESYSDQPFARFWMHNGLLDMGGKMAGSRGNVVNVVDMLKEFTAESARYLLLATHYRSPIDFLDWKQRLAELGRALEAFYRFFERYQRITGESFYSVVAPTTLADSSAKNLPESSVWRGAWQTFLEHMEDDFNTGGAVAVLYELLNKLNRFADERKAETDKKAEDIKELKTGAMVLRELSQILGLIWEPPAKKGGDNQVFDGLMKLLIDLRNEARKSKNYALGDQIRNRLKELSITLEDRAGETGWRIGS